MKQEKNPKEEQVKNNIKALRDKFTRLQSEGVRDYGLLLVPSLHYGGNGIIPRMDIFEASEEQREDAREYLAKTVSGIVLTK